MSEEKKAAKRSKHALKPAQQAEGDKALNAIRGKAAVECQLKSCLNPKYGVYQYFGLADGNVGHVSYGEEITAHMLPEKSKTVRDWRARQKRDEKRAEAKLAKEAEAKAAAKKEAK